MIKIELNEEEAQKFRIFMDNYNFFSALIDAGLYKPNHHEYVLHYDRFKVLRRIEAKHYVFEV